ncbi:AMP-binding protein [Chryseobacterium sp.]|uniref:AMP-binding protein n=1 Tax=Chryseobacterium sp. TaxID=1871047 RepID=UPI0025B87736|nr:AMP-binding protein [Chryseobacterium sp.]
MNTFSTTQTLGTGVAISLSQEDKERLLNDFNRTDWDYPKEETLLSLFQKQVSRFPEYVAAVFQDQQISYQELDERSNQVANALLTKGIKEGMYVPVWLDRSLEWIVAILGIIKTGAAYVPIDPAYPAKRVEFILSDTSAPLIITNSSLVDFLIKDINTETFVFDTMDDLSGWGTDATNNTLHQEALAYTIYTSGSTGNPKGVMVSHRSIQHLVTWHNQYFHVDHTSKLSLVAGLAFDISVWEMWSALTSGATIFIADNEERTEASALVNYYRKNKITHGFVPTVLAPSVVEKTKSYNDLNLKYLFTAGEKLKPVLTSELNYELVDYYGPTECTVYATFKKVKDMTGSIFHPSGNRLPMLRLIF